jgi:DNA-binding winged helix-turn-helix (wHTH) protein/tetratricopeptide (TPR) repeat protein/ABC-type transporter Mla MlaB component
VRARFGDFVLDGSDRVLSRGLAEVPLEPKVFDCLEFLVTRPGKLASVVELRQKLWPDAHVGEGALRRIINDLRRALGDTGSGQAMIRTRKGLGYVFVAPVELVTEPVRDRAETPTSQWPFVGRERELEQLQRWLKETPGGLCFVSGDAGAGKSSLITQLRAHDIGGARWLIGNCHSGLDQPALWPFREVAAQLVRAPEFRSHTLNFAEALPALRGVPELSKRALPTPEGGARSLRGIGFELYESFAELLHNVSQQRQLLIAIEDVHWADEASVALLDTLSRTARQRGLHVIATYRPEDVVAGKSLSQLLGRTSGREGTIALHLRALSLPAIESLLHELGYPSSDQHAAQALQRLTSGNALYVHELLRHALATDTPFDRVLPPSLSHIVDQRVALLPARTQRRLEQAAVLGRDLDVVLLRAAVGAGSTEALLRELQPALEIGVLRAQLERPERLQFSHAVLCDVVAMRVGLVERQSLHQAALRHLSSGSGGSAHDGALAVHAFEAGPLVEASERRRLCEQAGREALAQQSFDRAALQLGRAVQLLDPSDNSVAAAELTLLWAKARWAADDGDSDVDHAFEQAAERARRVGSAALLAEAAIGNAMGDDSVVDLRTAYLRPTALALADEAWAWLLREVDNDASRLVGELPYRLAAVRCWMRSEAGPLEAYMDAARLALQLAPPERDAARRMWLGALRATAELIQTDYSLAEFWQCLRDPELELRPRVEGLILALGGRLMNGDLSGYEQAAKQLAQLVELLPHPDRVGRLGARLTAYVATALCAPVTLAVIRGKLTEARTLLLGVANEARRRGMTPSKRGENNAFYTLNQLYAYRGHSAELEPLVDNALRESPGQRWLCSLLKAQFALERGDHQRAIDLYAPLRATAFQPQLDGRSVPVKPETLVRLADVCVAVGDASDAETLYALLSPRAQFCIQDGVLIAWGACGRPLGELAMRMGRHAEAEQHLSRAVAQNTAFGHVPETIRSQLALARLWLETGRRDAAQALIQESHAKALEIGMLPAAACAENLTARLR